MSSAKKVVSKLVDFGKSSAYLKNHSWLRFDPCGTLHLIVSVFDKELFMRRTAGNFTNNFQKI